MLLIKGLKGDPHIRKAIIDLKLCTECGECIKACGEREAIKDDFIVIDSRCIGCGDTYLIGLEIQKVSGFNLPNFEQNARLGYDAYRTGNH